MSKEGKIVFCTGGGCTAKLGAGVLSRILEKLPRGEKDPNLLVGYDRSVPKLRQASHCIGCNQCVPHCPQNIRIPQELHRIDRFAEHLKQDNL